MSIEISNLCKMTASVAAASRWLALAAVILVASSEADSAEASPCSGMGSDTSNNEAPATCNEQYGTGGAATPAPPAPSSGGMAPTSGRSGQLTDSQRLAAIALQHASRPGLLEELMHEAAVEGRHPAAAPGAEIPELEAPQPLGPVVQPAG